MRYLQYIIGIVILCLILFRVDLKQAIGAMSNVNILLLLAISLVTIPQIFLKSLRWRYLLKLQNIEYNADTISGDLTIESFMNEPFPGDSFQPSLFPGLF